MSAQNELRIADGYESALHDNGLVTLDDLFAIPNDQSLAKPGLDAWRERLKITLTIEGHARTFYLKRFCRPSTPAVRARGSTSNTVRSVAGVEWFWLNLLAENGVACAKAIALGEELDGRREVRSALLTEAVPGLSLEQWVTTWNEHDRPTIKKLLRPLAQLVRRLHEQGICHRDLYLSHVFHDPTAVVDASLCLIDLQRAIQPSWRLGRWIVKDLASLNFSAPSPLITQTDRVRWFRYYLGAARLDSGERGLLYRIVGKTDQIARHQRRRDRRLHGTKS